MKKIEVTIEGVTPLLFNRMTEDQLLALRTKKKPPKSAAREELPRDEAARKLYITDGKPYLPVEMLMSCLIGGGSYVRLDGKRQMSTGRSSVVPGFLSHPRAGTADHTRQVGG